MRNETKELRTAQPSRQHLKNDASSGLPARLLVGEPELACKTHTDAVRRTASTLATWQHAIRHRTRTSSSRRRLKRRGTQMRHVKPLFCLPMEGKTAQKSKHLHKQSKFKNQALSTRSTITITIIHIWILKRASPARGPGG